MRREILQPDADGRVSLDPLGLHGDVVVADEVEPGKWMVTAGQVVTEAGDEDAADHQALDDMPDDELEPDEATRLMDRRLARREKAEQAEKRPATKEERTTVAYGKSGGRVQRPANAPPPGGGRNR